MTDPTLPPIDDLAALRDWLASRPEPAAVRALGNRFDPRNPGPVTREQLIRLAVDANPDALVDLLPQWPAPDPLEAPLYAAAGEALGVACARRKADAPDAMLANTVQLGTVEAKGAYLRDAVALVVPYEVRLLGGWLAPHADAAPAWVKSAYAAALVACLPKLRKHERGDLFPYTALLDATAVEGFLRAAGKRAGLFDLAATRVAAQGHAPGAAGLAALLADKKLGRTAAALLASMGAVGTAAAQRLLDVPGAKPAAVELARVIVSLPAAPYSLWAGQQLSLPRFGRDPRADLRAPSDAVAARYEPTALAAIERALVELPARDLLPPNGWADLLQLCAIDPFLRDVPRAYERALAAGRLGLGADPDALTSAIDRLRWDSSITKSHSPQQWGYGWALLWAGCDRAVFRHAVARFELSQVANVLGSREYHFTNPLKELRPAWAPSVETLLRHYGADRDETAWLGPPPVLASLATPAASVELAAPSADLWIVGRVVGATRFTVRFRGDVTLAVDVAAERWTVTTPSPEHGPTPPLDAARGVQFAIEVARAGMYVGLDGAVLRGAFGELPEAVGPVRVVAEGEGALVTELELRAKYTARATEAAGALFTNLDSAQGYTEVAGMRSPAAAHCLAAAALLLDAPRATLARDALLTMAGEGLEPWQQRVRDTAAAPAVVTPSPAPTEAAPDAPAVPTDVAVPTAFGVRSFEDVVRVFHDLKLAGKTRAKKPPVLRRGMTAYGDYEYASFAPKPDTEDWGAHGAVPYPALYLSETSAATADMREFASTLAGFPCLVSKGRGASATIDYCVDPGRYTVAVLDLTSGGDYDDGGARVTAAVWRVDEGWCWGVMQGGDEPMRALIGVTALPPQVEWKRAERVVVGDW